VTFDSPQSEKSLESTDRSSSDRLRVFFVTEDDPIYVVEFFETFFSDYSADDLDVVGITVCAAFNESLAATARRIFRFYGWPDFGRLLVRYVRSRTNRRSISNAAASAGVPRVSTSSVNDAGFVRLLAELNLDVVVSVAAPEIFGPDLLNAPRVACLNVHSGRLPTYRGMMPIFWQLQRGEEAVTITVHRMTSRLDRGAIVATKAIAVSERDSLDRVMSVAKREAARLMMEALRTIRDADGYREYLPAETPSYFSFPTRSAVRQFRRRGHRLF
jgi:methionyl-tRNA formyltransferase